MAVRIRLKNLPEGQKQLEYLRRGSEQDVDLLYYWANESAVRKNSFSGRKITYEEHVSWYKKLLESSDAGQYIYVRDDEETGQARVVVRGDEAEISYSIAAEKRGMGYGKDMISLLTEKIRHDFPKVKKLVAKVKMDNVISRSIFLITGYTEKYITYEMEMDAGEE